MVWLPTRPELGDLIDAIKDRAVLRLDRGGRIVRCNRAAPEILGYPIRDLRSHDYSILFPDDHAGRERASQALEVAASDGHYEHQGWQARGDGSRFWAEVTIAPLGTRNGPALGYVAAIRDLTEPKRQEDGLRAALNISRAILTGLEPNLAFQKIADWARALVKADVAQVRIVDSSGTMLVLQGISVRRGSRVAGHVLRPEVPVQGSICGSVFEVGRPRLLSDPPTAVKGLSDVEATQLHEVMPGPTLIVPLRARKRTLGVLVVSNPTSRAALERHDMKTMVLFANQVILAVEDVRQRRERERLLLAEERRRLGRDVHDGVIQSLYAVTLSLNLAIEGAQDLRLKNQLASVTTQVDAVIANLRGLVRELRSTAGEP